MGSAKESDSGHPQVTDGVRLVDLLTGLSLVGDLGMAQPPEESLRAALVATGLARCLGLDEREVSHVLYTALLQHAGCTAFGHESAALLGGDDRAVNAAGARTDFTDPGDLLRTFLPHLAQGAGPVRRLRLTAAAVVHGSRMGRDLARATCEVAASVADGLGLATEVQTSLLQLFEWWNGRGAPGGLAGEQIALPTRITLVASVAMLFDTIGGVGAAQEALRRRAGRSLDPSLVHSFAAHGPDLLTQARGADPADAIVQAEPHPVRLVRRTRLVQVARTFGEMADLKSPWLHGHCTAVADLAHAAGQHLGLPEAASGGLRLAALLHDIGRAGVASGVWDKPGPLTTGEREQVRLHAHHGERILSRSPVLAPLAHLVGAHHERGDGSGYHRGSRAGALPMAARVLAAADVRAAMAQARPYRSALPPEVAAAELAQEARAGRLDHDAVAAVLTVFDGDEAVKPRRLRRDWPSGLTDRQVEVLRVLASGATNRQIARRLGISPRTTEHHVADVYTKLEVSSRAAAAMFAMRHDLLDPEGPPATDG